MKSAIKSAWGDGSFSSVPGLLISKKKAISRISFVISAGLIILSVISWVNHYHVLSVVEGALSILVILMVWFISKRIISVSLAPNILLSVGASYFTYLFLTGGIEGSGAYSIFIFPFAALLFKGAYFGTLWTCLFFIANAISLIVMRFFDIPIPYSELLLQRIVIVYMFAGGIAYFYESFRSKQYLQKGFDKSKFKSLIENASDVVAVVDAVGTLEFLSPSFERVLGHSKEELINQNAFHYIHKDDASEVSAVVTKLVLRPGTTEKVEFRFMHKNHEWIPMEAFGRSVIDNGAIRIVVNARDLTERKQMEAKLEQLATNDGLTKLYNRTYFNKKLKDEIYRAIRFKTPLSLLILDLDHFKHVNDTHGHQAGDNCVVALASLMKNLSRSVDTCARYGGDEFVIILPQTSIENAMVFAERLRQKVENMTVQYGDQTIQYTISIGAKVLSLTEENSAEELLKGADIALYKAKQRGRNCAVSYSIGDPSSGSLA
ncbi:MAG TPA: sensor domain-containing diguanylate cyclase [Balneolales bacterium]|nr:sensor domain-containing diguanylate cyclase [Balneolales bacterium]